MSCIKRYDQTSYGCLFCRTGYEKQIFLELERLYPEIRFLVPEKLLRVRIGGELHEKRKTLFPGYIFFQADCLFPAHQFVKTHGVFTLLADAKGIWQLSPSDEALVKRFYVSDGVIGLSKAYFEGNYIKPTNGILKDLEGYIIRVNRRKSKAQVRFQLGDKYVLTWLGFEEIEENTASSKKIEQICKLP